MINIEQSIFYSYLAITFVIFFTLLIINKLFSICRDKNNISIHEIGSSKYELFIKDSGLFLIISSTWPIFIGVITVFLIFRILYSIFK